MRKARLAVSQRAILFLPVRLVRSGFQSAVRAVAPDPRMLANTIRTHSPLPTVLAHTAAPALLAQRSPPTVRAHFGAAAV